MNKPLQTTLAVNSQNQIKKAWAFAINFSGSNATANIKTKRNNIRQSIQNYTGSTIMSCSKEARILGVKIGMKCEDAKLLIPELKVLVIAKD